MFRAALSVRKVSFPGREVHARCHLSCRPAHLHMIKVATTERSSLLTKAWRLCGTFAGQTNRSAALNRALRVLLDKCDLRSRECPN